MRAQQPHGEGFPTSSASSCVQLPQHTGIGASNCFLALVILGLVLTAGVSVTVCGFAGAKGFAGTMMSGGLSLRQMGCGI